MNEIIQKFVLKYNIYALNVITIISAAININSNNPVLLVYFICKAAEFILDPADDCQLFYFGDYVSTDPKI